MHVLVYTHKPFFLLLPKEPGYKATCVLYKLHRVCAALTYAHTHTALDLCRASLYLSLVSYDRLCPPRTGEESPC